MRLFKPKAPPRPRRLIETSGAEARELTRADIETDRLRHAEVAPLRAWLRRDYERNHYADALAVVFRGGTRDG